MPMQITTPDRRVEPDMDTTTSSKPWCVVTDPGTPDEYVEATQHRTHAEALHWVRQARSVGIPADVMKRLPDGSLTTEF